MEAKKKKKKKKRIYNYKKKKKKKKNSVELSTTKIGEHMPCEYSMSTIWTFDGIKNKHDIA